MYAQPRPCRGGRATSRERGGIGIAAGGKGEPPPPPPYTISDDDRGSPQTPGAGSAVGLGRRSVGLEPHESPTTPPHRRDGRTRCRPMQAAASTAPAILAAARRHAPAPKRGYRRRSRAACVVIRAAPGPLFDVTAAPGAGRCAPDPRPLSHPPDPPARRPLHCAPARAPIAKSRLSSAVRAPHTSRERRRVCGRAVPCTSRRHRAENPAHSAPTEAAGGRWPIATIVTKCCVTGSSPSCLGWSKRRAPTPPGPPAAPC